MRNDSITIYIYIIMLFLEFAKTLMIKMFGENIKVIIGDSDI